MAYYYKSGVIVPYVQKFYKQLILVVAGLFMASMAAMTLSAIAAVAPSFNEFTTTELTSWTADRTYPLGGVSSVSANGRTNVAQLLVDAQNRSSSSSFYYTEGIQKRADFGSSISADLFVDSAWENIGVRAGLWGIGIDSADAVSSYPIIEFTTRGVGGHVGWRAWDIFNGWVNLDTDFEYGQWASLQIELDSANDLYTYKINGVEVASYPSNSTESIDGAILNSYNYAETDYAVLWHNGFIPPVVLNSKEECKKDGWKLSEAPVFKNQGQCVSHFASGGTSTTARNKNQ